MRIDNNTNLIGNLVRDVYYKEDGDVKLAKFTVAVNTTKDITNFIPVTTFDKVAESCASYLKKGSKVAIDAYLADGHTEVDGEHTNYLNVVAQSVKFLDKPQDSKES